MTVLSIIFIGVAVALALVSRILKTKQMSASDNLSRQLQQSKSNADGCDVTDEDEWNAQWDEAEAAIDEDVYRLLNSTSGFFRWGAIGLAIVTVILFLTSIL